MLHIVSLTENYSKMADYFKGLSETASNIIEDIVNNNVL